MNSGVLHILKTSGIGGAERHLLTLLPGLVERGMELRVLVAATGDAERFVDALSASGVNVCVTPAGPDVNPLLYQRITKEIAEFRPKLLHTHLVHGDFHGLPAAERASLPAIASMHSAHGFYRRLPYRGPLRWASKKATRRIAISHFVERFATELSLADPGSIRVVHYGLDLDVWDADMPDGAAARARYGLEDGDVAFGIAARLIPGKGHTGLIEAFARAQEEAPQARLLIAGDGPSRSELEALVPTSARDRINFTGFVDDIASFLRACNVLVFPTLPHLGEGFGLAALEAMACSRPVIATTVGALPEVIDDERTGVLVAPEDEPVLAAAIVRLAGAPEERERMGRLGRERAESEFAAARMIDRTLAVYGEVLEPSRS